MAPRLPVTALLDGRPGHESQVRGLLACLPEPGDVQFMTLPPDPLPGERQLAVWALAVRHLSAKPPAGLLQELLGADYDTIARHGPRLIIAAGSRAGLYSYCLARILWASTVQAMTHGLLKTAFTLNVVPAHDHPTPGSHVVVVSTAPNPYLPEVAAEAARSFASVEGLDPQGTWWSLLMGGPPAGAGAEAVDALLVVAEVLELCRRATEASAELLISTSRRTPPMLTEALLQEVALQPAVRFFQDFRQDDRRTAGALLGLASQVFLTPDSISMVSEALWAGRGVTLLPLHRSLQGAPLLPPGKHARFLTPLLDAGDIRWITPSWDPPLSRTDPAYRHPDFLAIQTALRRLVTDLS